MSAQQEQPLPLRIDELSDTSADSVDIFVETLVWWRGADGGER